MLSRFPQESNQELCNKCSSHGCSRAPEVQFVNTVVLTSRELTQKDVSPYNGASPLHQELCTLTTPIRASVVSTAATTPVVFSGHNLTSNALPSPKSAKHSRAQAAFVVRQDLPVHRKCYKETITSPPCNSPISLKPEIPFIPRHLRWFVKLIYLIQQGPDASLDSLTLRPEEQLIHNVNGAVLSGHDSFPNPQKVESGASATSKLIDDHFCNSASLLNGSSTLSAKDERYESILNVGFQTFNDFDRTETVVKRNSWSPTKTSDDLCDEIETSMDPILKFGNDTCKKIPSATYPNLLKNGKILHDWRWDTDQIFKVYQMSYHMEFWFAAISALVHIIAVAVTGLAASSSSIYVHAQKKPYLFNQEIPGIIILGWLLVLFCLASVRVLLSVYIQNQIRRHYSNYLFFNTDARNGLIQLYRGLSVNLFRIIFFLHLGWLISGFFVLYGRALIIAPAFPASSKEAEATQGNTRNFNISVFQTYPVSYDTTLRSSLQSVSFWISQHFRLTLLLKYCEAVFLFNVALFGVHLVQFTVCWIGILFSLVSNRKSTMAVGLAILKQTPHGSSFNEPYHDNIHESMSSQNSNNFNISSELWHSSQSKQQEECISRSSQTPKRSAINTSYSHLYRNDIGTCTLKKKSNQRKDKWLHMTFPFPMVTSMNDTVTSLDNRLASTLNSCLTPPCSR